MSVSRHHSQGIAIEFDAPALRLADSRILQPVQFRQDLLAMVGWIHTRVDACDLPGGVDQECIPRGELHDSEVAQRTVGLGDLVVRVRQQFEIEALFGAELLVRIDAIEAHAQNNSMVFGVLGLVHLKLVGFAGSTGSLIFGIEIENDP